MIECVRVVSVPVSDQDRAKSFYTDTLGFELRIENVFGDGMRWIEVAPEGSTTSLSLLTWFDTMPPGSLQGLVFSWWTTFRPPTRSSLSKASLSTSRPGRCQAGCKRSSVIPMATGL